MENLIADIQIRKVDLTLLKKQKNHLLQIQQEGKITTKQSEAIDGIIGIIDAIQDYASDELGLNQKKVFSLKK